MVAIEAMMQRYKLDISILFLSTLAFAFACGEDTLDTDETTLRAGKGGKSGKNGKGSGGGGVSVAGDGTDGPIACWDNKFYPCGDGLDNDGDGLVDYNDPECTTPCDNHEGSLLTDMPGQNEDCKSDCYFDDNAGAGDDECEQNLQCDPLDPGGLIGCEYDSDLECPDSEQTDVCLETCLPVVPNGCDCFGCCEIADDYYVYLDGSPDCSVANTDGCRECTFNYECANTCETEDCELCVGQTTDQLPPECHGEPACPEGVASCTSHSDCGLVGFCSTGCCTSYL
jgi:hypothetical protein